MTGALKPEEKLLINFKYNKSIKVFVQFVWPFIKHFIAISFAIAVKWFRQYQTHTP
jgi:hypothetical protein